MHGGESLNRMKRSGPCLLMRDASARDRHPPGTNAGVAGCAAGLRVSAAASAAGSPGRLPDPAPPTRAGLPAGEKGPVVLLLGYGLRESANGQPVQRQVTSSCCLCSTSSHVCNRVPSVNA
jgi:hypothetical protein